MKTLEDAAHAAVALARGRPPKPAPAAEERRRFRNSARGQRYVRGLYSGGTFCYEASLLLGEALSPSLLERAGRQDRIALRRRLEEPGHTVVDLGDDLFTRGRPHPMIDQRLRNERIVEEATDPETR